MDSIEPTFCLPPPAFNQTVSVYFLTNSQACQPLQLNLANYIVIVPRNDSCTFQEQAEIVVNASGSAVLVQDSQEDNWDEPSYLTSYSGIDAPLPLICLLIKKSDTLKLVNTTKIILFQDTIRSDQNMTLSLLGSIYSPDPCRWVNLYELPSRPSIWLSCNHHGMIISLDPYSNWNPTLPVLPSLRNFTKLKHIGLHLSQKLNESWVPELFELPFLESINVRENDISGSLSLNFCPPNLRYLRLAFNHFTGNLPECLFQLSELKILELWTNNFTGILPSFISLPKLTYFDLESNKFSGLIPSFLFENSPKVRELYLTNNNFSGSIPTALFQLSQLEFLSLSENEFSGTLPSSIYLPVLTYLSLESNKFSGILPSLLFENSPKVNDLYLANNNFSGSIPTALFQLSQLEILSLSQNGFSGTLPSSIYLPELNWISVSSNLFTGTIPATFWQCPKLTVFSADNNSFYGELIFGDAIAPLKNIFLSDNNLTGPLPDLRKLTNLTLFDVSGNQFYSIKTFQVPSSIEEIWLSQNDLPEQPLANIEWLFTLPMIKVVALEVNRFSGTLPTNYSSTFTDIALSGNKLTGTIPEALFQLPELQLLTLGSNNLEGRIPSNITAINLDLVYLADNQFYGNVTQLFTLPNISSIFLQRNQFSGEFPSEYGPNLKYLDLGGNKFNGSLTSILQIPKLRSLWLSRNGITGQLPNKFPSGLEKLDLSYNALTGNVPASLLQLEGLAELNLVSNKLDGPIPSNITSPLTSLLASNNQLTGIIPKSLLLLETLQTLDLGSNFLSLPDLEHTNQRSQLKILSLDNNRLTNVSSLANFTKLVNLYLESNALTELPDLTQLKELKILRGTNNSIFGCPVFPENVEVLALAHNRINCFREDFLSALNRLQQLDLSSNQMSGLFESFIGSLSQTLLVLDASNNSFTGTLTVTPSRFVVVAETDRALFSISETLRTDLLSINISYNQLSQIQVAPLAYRSALTLIDARGNQISRTLLDDTCFYPLTTVILDDNPFDTDLPAHVVMIYDQPVPKKGIICPTLRCDYSEKSLLSLDLSYRNYSLCKCLPGFFRYNETSNCYPCLENAVCLGGEFKNATSPNMYAKRGYYPIPSAELAKQMVACQFASLTVDSSVNPCNPNASGIFSCAVGSQGRLCSACQPNFIWKQGVCLSCLRSIEYPLLLISVITLVTVSLGGIMVKAPYEEETKKKQVMMSVSTKIFTAIIEFLQTSSIIVSKLSKGTAIQSLHTFFSALSFSSSSSSFGLECINDKFHNFRLQYAIFVSLPALYIGLLAIACAIRSCVFKFVFKKPRVPGRYLFINGSFWILSLIYLPVVTFIANVFKCSSTDYTQISYLADRPYLTCDTITTLGKIISVLVYPVGIFMTFLIVCTYIKIYPDAFQNPDFLHCFGFFYSNYKQARVLGGPFYLLAKLLLSLFVALIPATHDTYATLISAVLVGKIFFTILRQPYDTLRYNNMQVVTDFATLFLFYNAIISSAGSQFQQQGYSPVIIYFTTNIATITYVIWVGKKLYPERVNAAMERSRSRGRGKSGRVELELQTSRHPPSASQSPSVDEGELRYLNSTSGIPASPSLTDGGGRGLQHLSSISRPASIIDG